MQILLMLKMLTLLIVLVYINYLYGTSTSVTHLSDFFSNTYEKNYEDHLIFFDKSWCLITSAI